MFSLAALLKPKWLWCYFNLLPFHLTSFILRALYAQLTLCRPKGWWKLTKLNRASLILPTKNYGPSSTTTMAAYNFL